MFEARFDLGQRHFAWLNHMANRTKLTNRACEAFLDVLRETCNVSEAARSIGVSRSAIYDRREKNEKFAAAWDEAEQEAADALEREAWRRGVEGVDKPVVYKGEVTDTYKEYSDRMLELLLKAHRPEKFKERVSKEVSGPNGGPIPIEETPASARLNDVLSRIAPEETTDEDFEAAE